MGRAKGSNQPASEALRRGGWGGRSDGRSWLGARSYQQVCEGAYRVLAAGTMAGAAASLASRGGQAGTSRESDTEMSRLWADAAQTMRSTLPALEHATVIAAPAKLMPDVPAHADNAARAATARTLRLPTNPLFLDFGNLGPEAWVLTDPEPVLLSAACCWDDGEVLSLAPVWAPLDPVSMAAARSDPASFGHAPGYRLVVGDADAVMEHLQPGTLGLTADGDFVLWGELNPLQDVAAQRTERFALRVIDALSFLAERGVYHEPRQQGSHWRPGHFDVPHAPAPRSTTQHLVRSGRVHVAASVGRNDPCPCGSGAKYKRCCGS